MSDRLDLTAPMPSGEPDEAPALPFLPPPELPDPGAGCRRLSDTILCTDDLARHVEVFNAHTGEVMMLVESVCVREGWLRRYVTVPGPSGPIIVADDEGKISVETLRGPCRIRPRSSGRPTATPSQV